MVIVGCSTFKTNDIDPEIKAFNKQMEKDMQDQCVRDHTFTYRLFHPEHAHNWPVWGRVIAWIGPGHWPSCRIGTGAVSTIRGWFGIEEKIIEKSNIDYKSSPDLLKTGKYKDVPIELKSLPDIGIFDGLPE